MKIKLIFLLFIFLSFNVCTHDKINQEKRKQAFETKEKAYLLYINPTIEIMLTGKERTQKILSLLDQSIAVDSGFMPAYSLKAQVLSDDSCYFEAIDLLNQALLREDQIDSDMESLLPRMYLQKGILFEKLHSIESAQENYSKAIFMLDLTLQKDSLNFQASLNRSFLHIFVNDENAAVEDLKILRNRNLSDEEYYQIDFMIDMIEKTNRSEIVKNTNIF